METETLNELDTFFKIFVGMVVVMLILNRLGLL